MSDLVIEDQELAQRLREIAAQEHRPVEDVLRSMMEKYKAQPSSGEELQSMLDAFEKRVAETDPLEAFLGMFDDDITDLSSITKEDVLETYRKKYGDTN